MNRILPVFLVIVTFFCGCAKVQGPPIKDSFDFKATIYYLGKEYKAKIFASAADVFSIEFIEPQKIDGLALKWDADNGIITYKNLEYKFTLDNAPEIFFDIHSAFNMLFLNRDDAVVRDDRYLIEKDGIMLELNKDGIPTKIETDSVKVIITQ